MSKLTNKVLKSIGTNEARQLLKTEIATKQIQNIFAPVPKGE